MVDVLKATLEGRVIEVNEDALLGPSVLVLGHTGAGLPLHALWGIIRGGAGPAYLVTVYRPSLEEWDEGFSRRSLR